MIHRLLGWFRKLGESEYWRMRALKAEARLEAETWRNREREDTLATVPMRAMGMFGMTPRSAPAGVASQPTRLLQTADPFESLSAMDKMEFQTQWLEAAKTNGIPIDQAKRDFVLMVQRRNLGSESVM
jgi:hypothetical protein